MLEEQPKTDISSFAFTNYCRVSVFLMHGRTWSFMYFVFRPILLHLPRLKLSQPNHESNLWSCIPRIAEIAVALFMGRNGEQQPVVHERITFEHSSTMATAAPSLESIYAFTPQQTNETFEDVGYGPLVVKRLDLLQEIIQYASPKKSAHISGCKGAGKTTVLNQIGELLVRNSKTVLFFENATTFQQLDVNKWIRTMAAEKEEAYILVDETHANVNSDMFTVLLKNTRNHRLTTIGAGVPHYQTICGSFKKSITTDRLFVSEDMLVEEGITDYFASNTTGETRAAIEKLLQFIRSHVGGHIYPLMWLAEHLVPKVKDEGFSVEKVIRYFESNDLRGQEEFQEMVQRILPDVRVTDVHPLLYREPDDRALADLQKKGFCDSNGMIVSQFLFENFVSHQGGKGTSLATKLNHGIDGVQQLLSHTLPKLNWDQYGPHGGPIKDAMTFELLLGLSKVKQLDTRLFNPKLINAGTTARKPDLYLNSTIDSYVECVVTSANNATERRSLDEHISRFYRNTDGDVYYNIGDSSFAIINYQLEGTVPLQPENQYFRVQVFDERVFTFIMSTKEVYRGNTLIASPRMQDIRILNSLESLSNQSPNKAPLYSFLH